MDLLIIGSGPSGMAAAIAARQQGLAVMVIDEQPAPGGQIWRSVETAESRDNILGPSYSEGRKITNTFRNCGADYLPGTQLWQLEPGFHAFVSKGREVREIHAKAVIIAAGAQERPVPFPGWTLPGVWTVGAAQILLKGAGQIPTGSTWIAGCGPLPLLYATQFIRAGGKLAGYLDTTPPGQWLSAIPHLPKALRSVADLAKGLAWMAKLKSSGARIVKGVTEIEGFGQNKIENIRFRTDAWQPISEANAILVHEGVIPNIHIPMSLDCRMIWSDRQDAFLPVLDIWGESSHPNLFITGDSAGIAGAKAALLRGEIAALRIAAKLGHMTDKDAEAAATPIRRKLDRELSARPFLEVLFKPRPQVFAPADETIVCRCEEVTAGEIRKLSLIGQPGPNQIKAASRAGMGPCQGRQCGYTVTRILSSAQGRAPSDVGFYHVRPPLKPVTLGELASLAPPIEPVSHQSDPRQLSHHQSLRDE